MPPAGVVHVPPALRSFIPIPTCGLWNQPQWLPGCGPWRGPECPHSCVAAQEGPMVRLEQAPFSIWQQEPSKPTPDHDSPQCKLPFPLSLISCPFLSSPPTLATLAILLPIHAVPTVDLCTCCSLCPGGLRPGVCTGPTYHSDLR